METNYLLLDPATLRELYTAEAARLKAALLEGKDWSEIQELRHKVIDLEIALHRKTAPASDGATAPKDLEESGSSQ